VAGASHEAASLARGKSQFGTSSGGRLSRGSFSSMILEERVQIFGFSHLKSYVARETVDDEGLRLTNQFIDVAFKL
jgi:hypothetical protein